MLKKELLAKAKELKIKGRSKMTKEELVDAIKKAGGVVEDGEKDDKKKMKQAKIDEMYKVDTPKKIVKKVAKKAEPSPKMQQQMKQKEKDVAADSKRPKMSPKIAAQLKAKMQEVAADQGKK